jgi:hypothetical protein
MNSKTHSPYCATNSLKTWRRARSRVVEDSLTVCVKIAQGIGLNPIGENTKQQMTG